MTNEARREGRIVATYVYHATPLPPLRQAKITIEGWFNRRPPGRRRRKR